MAVDSEQLDTGQPARFALVEDDDQEVLGSALDLDGFFVERGPDPQVWRTFWVLGCTPRGVLARYCARPGDRQQRLGNLDLTVLDTKGDTIGSYWVGDASAEQCRPSSAGADAVDIAMTGLLLSLPHPRAGAMWDLWRAGRPTSPNLWAEYSLDGREAWLEVVRLSSTWQHPTDADSPSGRTVELDGTHVTDQPSLWCAMGEAVNGPGGYFGADLDGLRDCLRGGFGATVPFRLVWQAADVAARTQESLFRAVLAVLAEAKVEVISR